MNGADPRARAAEISYRQCRLFESVGRLGSVRRGSEECNLSQPAVTQALSKLEQHIGATLLMRGTSGSFLTDAGKLFHTRVQRMFSQVVSALKDAGIENPIIVANRLSTAQVRILVAVVEHASLAKAAGALGLTQTSLQRSARYLEGSLGQSLLYRTSTGVMVRPEGIELGRRFKLATQETEWGLAEIHEAHGAQSGQLILGTLPSGSSMLLASVMGDFMQRYPETRLRVLTEGASEMMRRLRFGDVDLVVGIIQETADNDLTHQVLAHTQFRIVVRKEHPLVQRDRITLEDLAGYEWVVGLEGSSRRLCFDALFKGRPAPRTLVETSTVPIIRQLLRNGDRITLMTDYELKHEAGPIVAVPFDILPVTPAVGITMRTDWLPTRIHEAFAEFMRQRLQQLLVAA